MADREIPLYASASAAFVSDGAGGSIATATLGPAVYGSSWVIDSMVTNTNSDQSQFGGSELRVYQGAISPSADRGGSWTGDNDSFSGDPIILQTLDKLIFVWTKGNIGSVATIIVRGVQKDRGR